MKPPEILAMIEEAAAAGIRMYEAKKQQAEKTIEKKDAKLKEINDILAEEINPTLTKLKEERSAYLEFQRIKRELEHLTKLYLTWKFCCAEETAVNTMEELESIKTKLEEIQELIRQGEEVMAEIDVAIRELESARDNEMGGQVSEKEKHEAKVTSALKTLKDNVIQEDKKKKQIEKGLELGG
jgi:structural maintenance of chromosome 2